MTTTAAWTPRRAYRDRDRRWLGGVASGVAGHLGVRVDVVRWGFAGTSLLSGFGVVLYALLWVVLPAGRGIADAADSTSSPGSAAAARDGRRRSPRRIREVGGWVAVGVFAAGVVGLVAAVTGRGLLVWAVAAVVAAIVVVWRQADAAEDDRASGRVRGAAASLLGSGGPAAWLRVVAGLLLVPAAVVAAVAGSGGAGLVAVFVAVVLGMAGLAVVAGPWVMRLAGDYSREREERARADERADVAVHLHDSVLQTLALIQRSAGDATAVATLARSQERELRTWLFDAHGAADGGPADLTVLLDAVAAEVERSSGTPVEVVVVGSVQLPASAPLVLATREAALNAARHSGAGRVDVYAEVAATDIEVFVRDRGCGFDLVSVPADRGGLRLSVIDRVARAGGEAHVRSAPGSGTEVRLRVPREEPVA